MTTSYTEDYHAAAFILSEANGGRSRESATVVSGQTLKAGQAVQDNGSGKLTACDGNLTTDGDASTAAVGIVIYAVDASGGDVANCAYIARDAEVNDNLITYPDESSAGGEKDSVVASLETLGIIVR